MKKYTLIFLIFFSLILGWSCQRDDICPETVDTTPLLIIRFYENEAPFDFKAPQNLSIRAVGNENYIINTTNSGNVIKYYRYSQDSIAIPLKTDNDVSQFILTVNTPDSTASDPVPGITDTITFSYGREQEYLNRACAFKINYIGLKTDLVDSNSDTNWIQDIEVEEINVEDENQAHVSIFF